MSLYIRNAPAGTQMRVVWNDIAKSAALGEDVKAVGDKVSWRSRRRLRCPTEATCDDVLQAIRGQAVGEPGSHDFKVGNKLT